MLFSRIRELRREVDLRTRTLGGGELAQECCTWRRGGAERGAGGGEEQSVGWGAGGGGSGGGGGRGGGGAERGVGRAGGRGGVSGGEEQSGGRGGGDGGGTFPGDLRLASRSVGRVCLPPHWLGKGGGSDGQDRPGWGSGGVRGRRPGPQAGSRGSWTRDLSASSAPATLHLPSPRPTAPAHCPAQGKGWKWTLLDFIHVCI